MPGIASQRGFWAMRDVQWPRGFRVRACNCDRTAFGFINHRDYLGRDNFISGLDIVDHITCFWQWIGTG
jgi:hypothetical protein